MVMEIGRGQMLPRQGGGGEWMELSFYTYVVTNVGHTVSELGSKLILDL